MTYNPENTYNRMQTIFLLKNYFYKCQFKVSITIFLKQTAIFLKIKCENL